MSKIKDEWFDQFYKDGKYPMQHDTPQWHEPSVGKKTSTGGHGKPSDNIKKPWNNNPFAQRVDATTTELNYQFTINTELKNQMFISNVVEEFKKALFTFIKKHEDYGSTNISNAPGGALNGLAVRLHDKIARLSNLNGKKNPNYESLYDTFMDVANYGVIGMLILEDKWDKG